MVLEMVFKILFKQTTTVCPNPDLKRRKIKFNVKIISKNIFISIVIFSAADYFNDGKLSGMAYLKIG